MLCPSCGRDVGDHVGLCDDCAQRQSVFGFGSDTASTPSLSESTVAASLEKNKGAGFWIRVFALIIDCAVLFSVFEVVFVLVFACLRYRAGEGAPVVLNRSSEEVAALAMELGAVFWGISLALTGLIYLMYYVFFEVLPSQGTVGKSVLGLVVTDNMGGYPGFFRVVLRNAGKLFSLLMFGFGFLMVSLTARRQAFHDLLSGCCVVRRRRVGPLRVVLSVLSAIALPVILSTAFAIAISLEVYGPGSVEDFKIRRKVPKPTAVVKQKAQTPQKTATSVGVTGVVRGEIFSPDRAEFFAASSRLAFRQGSGYLPEAEVVLFLFLNQNLEEGKRIVVNSSSGMLIPHLHVKWRARGSGVPENAVYSSKEKYTLDLLFEELGRGYVRGTITLVVNDEPATKLSGRFIAALK